MPKRRCTTTQLDSQSATPLMVCDALIHSVSPRMMVPVPSVTMKASISK